MNSEEKFVINTHGAPSDVKYHAMRKGGYIQYYVLTNEIAALVADGYEYLGPSNSVRAAEQENVK